MIVAAIIAYTALAIAFGYRIGRAIQHRREHEADMADRLRKATQYQVTGGDWI